MYDPQTSGGILAHVPHTQTRDCLQRLHQAGYSQQLWLGISLTARDFSLKMK